MRRTDGAGDFGAVGTTFFPWRTVMQSQTSTALRGSPRGKIGALCAIANIVSMDGMITKWINSVPLLLQTLLAGLGESGLGRCPLLVATRTLTRQAAFGPWHCFFVNPARVMGCTQEST